METHFYVDTETYAEKAKQLLSRYRYRFQVRKMTSAAGCRYQFTVMGPSAELFSLLTVNRLPFRTI